MVQERKSMGDDKIKKMRPVKNGWTYGSLVATAVIWGSIFNVGKMTETVLPPMTMVAWRFIVAALCMMAVFWIRERPRAEDIRRNLAMYAVLGVVGIFGFNALMFIGLKNTSAVNAVLIMAMNPLVTAVLSAPILGERIRPRQGAGVALSLVGVLFVITRGSLSSLRGFSAGDLLIFGGSVCWSLYGVLGRKYLKGSTPTATSAMTMAFGALCFLPFAPLRLEVGEGPALVDAWIGVMFMAIFGSVLGYLWWNRGIEKIGANRTSIFFNLAPVSTMVISGLTGGSVTGIQVLGAGLVLTGVVLATRRMGRSPEKAAAEETPDGGTSGMLVCDSDGC